MGRRIVANPHVLVGYVRISKDDGRGQLGPAAQRHALEAYANAHGCLLVDVFEDIGVSGGTNLAARPGLTAALAAMEQCGAGSLLVHKRDRLARATGVAQDVERALRKRGRRVITADGVAAGTTPEDEAMRGMQDVFAAMERAKIRQRTRDALAAKRRRSERTGDIRIGEQLAADGVHVVPCAAEAEAVALIRQLSADGQTIRGSPPP